MRVDEHIQVLYASPNMWGRSPPCAFSAETSTHPDQPQETDSVANSNAGERHAGLQPRTHIFNETALAAHPCQQAKGNAQWLQTSNGSAKRLPTTLGLQQDSTAQSGFAQIG